MNLLPYSMLYIEHHILPPNICGHPSRQLPHKGTYLATVHPSLIRTSYLYHVLLYIPVKEFENNKNHKIEHMRRKVIKQFTHKETNKKNYFVFFCDIRRYCRSNKLINVNYFQLLIPCHDIFVMHIELINNAYQNRILSLDCQFHIMFNI